MANIFRSATPDPVLAGTIRENAYRLTGAAQDYDPLLEMIGDARFVLIGVLVGFTTYTGSVTAASDWDRPAERKRVRPGMEGSYEKLFHDMDLPRFLMTLRDNDKLAEPLRTPMLERAVGVIYLPQSERWSHYFDARLADQFDAVIHIDETRALEPLERTPGWEQGGEVPETYPTAV